MRRFARVTARDDEARFAANLIATVASGLEIPWGMVFLDRDRILLTEKPGRMRIVEKGALLPGQLIAFSSRATSPATLTLRCSASRAT